MTAPPTPSLASDFAAEVAALRAALAEAVSLLAAVDSDANNVQLDIMRWRRRHHQVVSDA